MLSLIYLQILKTGGGGGPELIFCSSPIALSYNYSIKVHGPGALPDENMLQLPNQSATQYYNQTSSTVKQRLRVPHNFNCFAAASDVTQ